jgi:cytochrome c-type biogenesis protein
MYDLMFFGTVLLAGMTSFMMPCILPLIPAYLTYLTGKTAEGDFNDPLVHKSLTINSLAFISGFVIVFVLLGAAATSLGRLLLNNQDIIRRIGGIFISFMGLFHMGLIPLKFMERERRFRFIPSSPGLFQSIAIGAGFGFGWTPCMGPVLASLLIIASQTNTVGMGMLLLSIYGIGLGIPFFALALGYKVFWKRMHILKKHAGIIKKISGVILILLGILIYYNKIMFIVL